MPLPTAALVVVAAVLLRHGAHAQTLRVDAGADQTLTLFYNTVTLRATTARASGGITVAWVQTTGPSSAQLSGASTLTPQVVFEDGGTYTFQVTVQDAGGRTATDTTRVFVNAEHRSVPGRLQAEDADLGNGLGYADTTAGNEFGAYTRNDDLDVAAHADNSGFYVDGIDRLEWLRFSVLSQVGCFDFLPLSLF